jgi:Uncharacterised protein family (UPF0158)
VEHMHPRTLWQPRAEVARQLELVAGPAALADEWSGDQHDRPEPPLRRLLGERIDEDCRAHRMTGHDRAVVQVRHLTSDRRAPPGVSRVALVGHMRVADLVPSPELSPQAFDQLVVPFVVRAHAAALDEQDLPSNCHGDHPSHLRDDPIRYPPLAGVNPGGGASLVEDHDGFAANILNCNALADQTDAGIDGQAPVDLDELDLVCIDPLPSWVWYQDMADFAETITDERAGRRLARAIQGKGAFRRFKDELHDEYPDLLPAWYAFRDVRARRRAVQWLAGNSLIDDDAAGRFLASHPDPDLP